MIRVISTSFNPPSEAHDRCVRSVTDQILSDDVLHTYVNAGTQTIVRSALENFWNAAVGADPDDILVWLDGDDWLLTRSALSIVLEAYEDPNCWMTYGSFKYADGRPGFASAYTDDNFRGSLWRATHLKTFRAKLFHRLTPEDLKRDGKFRDVCIDMAVMVPLLEMSGLEHSRFIPDILYVYNYANSFEMNASPSERAREKAMAAEIRALPRKERLLSL